MRYTLIALKPMLLKYITLGIERRSNNIHQNINILYQIFNSVELQGIYFLLCTAFSIPFTINIFVIQKSIFIIK